MFGLMQSTNVLMSGKQLSLQSDSLFCYIAAKSSDSNSDKSNRCADTCDTSSLWSRHWQLVNGQSMSLEQLYLLSCVFIYLITYAFDDCQSCLHCICGKIIYCKNLDMNCLHDDRPWTQESLIDVCVTVGVMVRVNDNVGRRTTLSCGSLVVTLLLLVLSSCLRFIVCANIFISSVYVCSDGS